MSLTIPAHDHGTIRVFAAPRPLPAGLIEKTPAALAAAFGTADLDPDFIDVLDPGDLGGLTLVRYLETGYDMTPDAVDEAALATIDGYAILILSRAARGQVMTLTPAPGITHVTTITPSPRMRVDASLTSDAAAREEADKAATDTIPQKPAPSDAAMSGRVAMIALVILFALVGLMVWVGG